jgi:hypothetical protein
VFLELIFFEGTKTLLSRNFNDKELISGGEVEPEMAEVQHRDQLTRVTFRLFSYGFLYVLCR